jgi:NADH:ubiquinone oxidoreductase subunit E
MGISLREKIKQLPEEQQQQIAERSAELIAEEKKRQQLRQLLKIAQEQNGDFLQKALIDTLSTKSTESTIKNIY